MHTHNACSTNVYILFSFTFSAEQKSGHAWNQSSEALLLGSDYAERSNRGERKIQCKLIDCSIIGPLKLPFVANFVWFFFPFFFFNTTFLFILISHIESKAPKPKAVPTSASWHSSTHTHINTICRRSHKAWGMEPNRRKSLLIFNGGTQAADLRA